ncbi:MAG: hypothetical protein NTAFB05_26560 [Nitrobacter sp.]|uniref:DUF4424 family protein n=1 Tax=Nitrobacter sp. TaxID=29420 RepID=UPI00387DEBB0
MMRGRLAAISFAVAVALAAAPALAADEGRGIGYAATGLVFDLPAGVSVERLEVHVSFYSVRLAYVFKSRRRLTVHFRFALPDMPVDAGEDIAALDKDSEAAGLAADTQPANYMNLSVRVDGKPVVLGGHGRALLDGKDVTRQLLDAGVPLLSGPAGSAWRRLTPDVRTKLEASRLISIDAAAWTYQADFAWDAMLEPGETSVEISYATLAKYWSDITVDHFPEIAPDGSATRAYCIDDALRRAFFRKPFSYDIYTVTHLAAPAGHWRGPVGHYRLVIDKGAATNLVAFCPLSAKKISPTTFEWTAVNFTQDSPTGVLFFMDQNAASSGARE